MDNDEIVFSKETPTKQLSINNNDHDIFNSIKVEKPTEQTEEYIGLNFSDDEDNNPVNLPLPESPKLSEFEFRGTTENRGNSFYQEPEPEPENDDTLDKAFMINFINKFYKEENLNREVYMSDSFIKIKNEYDRIKIQRSSENGCEFLKSGLAFVFHGMEFVDKKITKTNTLDGYGSYMKRSLSNNASVDELLTEIYKKYYNAIPESPELKLIFIIMTNTFMFIAAKRISVPVSPEPEPQGMRRPKQSTEELLASLEEPGTPGTNNDDGSDSIGGIKIINPIPEEKKKRRRRKVV